MALDDFSLVDSVAIPNVISFVLNKSAITLYPNLSTGNFVIDFTNNTNVISSIDIINTQGVVLRRIQQPVYNKVLPINISEMENAIYFVRIVTVQGEQVVQKLTKDYSGYKYFGAKGLVVMAKNFYGLKDSFQATYILDSVIKNFTSFPDVLEEAQKELDFIKTEEAKTNSSITK